MDLDSFQEIDHWMLFLSRNSVRELVLANSNRHYGLPSYVFSCSELRELKLMTCIFKPPLEFEGFLNLVDLFLENVDFKANSCGTLATLPLLKRLCLRSCTNVYNFNIEARTLQMLYVIACPDALLLWLLDSPCFTTVVITFEKPIEDVNVHGERMDLARLLSNMPKIQRFAIDNHFFKILSADEIPKWFPHAVNSLKYLSLINFRLADLDQLYGALCLLRNSPNLDRLRLCVELEPHYDVGLASNHLESPDCLDHTMSQLRTVEIYTFGGSRPELLFIKLLLTHSPSLREMTIKPSKTFDIHKRHDIAKDVMRFSRASPKAEMIYLDPNP